MNKYLINKINYLINSTKATYLSSKILYKGNFINLIEEQYLLPNNVLMKREKIIKNNKEAGIVIAITDDNKYILVSQNRINRITTLEFPSGYIESNENIIEASKRELLEETGYTSNDIKILDNYYSQIGIDSSIVNIVVASNCTKITNQNLRKYEYINYDEFTFEELEELINQNYINGCGNKLAFYELLNFKQDKPKILYK